MYPFVRRLSAVALVLLLLAPAAGISLAVAADPAPTADAAAAPAAAPTEAAPAAGADPASAEAAGTTADPAASAEADPGAVATEEAEEEEEPAESPWSFGLVISMAALGFGGTCAVLGIWVDRDKTRPLTFAFAMSGLISAAILIGLTQSYLDAEAAVQQRADLARMLDMVNEIAVASGDTELAKLVQDEGGPVVEVVPIEKAPEGEATAEGSPPAEGEAPAEGVAPAEGTPPTEATPTTP